MKTKKLLITMIAASALSIQAQEKLIIINEGLWQSDNGRVTYFEDGRVISNQWFRDINGYKLGDTPSDIIQINSNLIAIAVNWSNIVQFISPDGHAVAASEDIPNNRKLATDGRYVYVSSYGHECVTANGKMKFEKGFVAKIDTETFRVISAVEVGYEPEGIAFYMGHLFVANSGGYAFQEDHEYESTVSVIDAEKMEVVRTVDTGHINLYGKMSQSGQYLCINSPGDYYEVDASTVIFDCRAALDGLPDNDCCASLDYASTYNCVNSDGNFFAIGSRYSYLSGEYTFDYNTINPEEVMESNGEEGVYEELPGSISDDIRQMAMPYGIYVNPYTGYIYGTDAGAFTGAGELYQWTPDGILIGTHKLYINPAHFLALAPANIPGCAFDTSVASGHTDNPFYDLKGSIIQQPAENQIYIHNGKKIIFQSNNHKN